MGASINHFSSSQGNPPKSSFNSEQNLPPKVMTLEGDCHDPVPINLIYIKGNK